MIGAGSRKRSIGLLGGSFNPAHEGHRMISLIALKRLSLDEVWWLVSPQNPLKPADGMAPFIDRLANAQTVANHRRIKVSDIELRLGTHYTRDTLKSSPIEGPAIIEQFDSTTVLPPGWTAKLDSFGNIIGERNA